MAILNQFSAILLYCDSNHFWLLAADSLAIPGPRFWESCDSRSRAAKHTPTPHAPLSLMGRRDPSHNLSSKGSTPKGLRGCSGSFWNPCRRTPSENPSRNVFSCKIHSKPPSKNPSENPSPEPQNFLRTPDLRSV